jgi:hypothetical protein
VARKRLTLSECRKALGQNFRGSDADVERLIDFGQAFAELLTIQFEQESKIDNEHEDSKSDKDSGGDLLPRIH